VVAKSNQSKITTNLVAHHSLNCVDGKLNGRTTKKQSFTKHSPETALLQKLKVVPFSLSHHNIWWWYFYLLFYPDWKLLWFTELETLTELS
jgi:hypothetical protein